MCSSPWSATALLASRLITTEINTVPRLPSPKPPSTTTATCNLQRQLLATFSFSTTHPHTTPGVQALPALVCTVPVATQSNTQLRLHTSCSPTDCAFGRVMKCAWGASSHASCQVLLEEGHEAVKRQLGLICGRVCLPHLCTPKTVQVCSTARHIAKQIWYTAFFGVVQSISDMHTLLTGLSNEDSSRVGNSLQHRAEHVPRDSTVPPLTFYLFPAPSSESIHEGVAAVCIHEQLHRGTRSLHLVHHCSN